MLRSTPLHLWRFVLRAMLACLAIGEAELAQAESRVRLVGTAPKLWELSLAAETPAAHAQQSSRFQRSSPLRLAGAAPGLGRFQLTLDEQRTERWRSESIDSRRTQSSDRSVLLLKGRLIYRSRSGIALAPIAAYLTRKGGDARLRLTFSNISRASLRSRFYQADLRISKTGKLRKARLSRIPAELLGKHANCGSLLPPHASAHSLTNATPDSLTTLSDGPVREVQIALDADYEYYQELGGNTENEMVQTINAAEIIYDRDVNLVFDVTSTRIQTSSSQPFTSTDAETLLNQYTTYANSNPPSATYDVQHLFTGKTMDSGVAGIAWVGVICNSPTYSTGVTMRLVSGLTELDYIIFSHEVGHNFSAAHDSVLPRSVMYPSVNSTQTFFSSTSQGDVEGHVASFGASCLTLLSTPTPTPTATSTPTSTSTPTVTPTPLVTSTPTPAATPSPNPTSTTPPSVDPSATPTPTPTSVPEESPSVTPTTAPLELILSVERARYGLQKLRIVGTVTDQNLAPQEGISVQLLRSRTTVGSRTFQVLRTKVTSSDGTVDFVVRRNDFRYRLRLAP